MRVLCAPDKFRGTLNALGAAEAMAAGARAAGWTVDLAPISDGGEGFLSCFDGDDVFYEAPGPLGETTTAPVRYDGNTAYIEMATVAGRQLLNAPTPDQAFAATTEGVGILIRAAADHGATSIIVGCGGSATTDGGIGCLEALDGWRPAPEVSLRAAVDVEVPFRSALDFAAQKGIDPSQRGVLVARLEAAAERLDAIGGRRVSFEAGTGAAGGLAGALVSVGAEIRLGISIVIEHLNLEARAATADLVLTGEGRFDLTSLHGKAPFALLRTLRSARQLALCCGTIDNGAEPALRAALGARHVDIATLWRREDRTCDPVVPATALAFATAQLCARAALHA